VLPHTPKAGATVAATRVRIGVRDVLGAKDDSVRMEVFCTTEETTEIETLVRSIRPEPAVHTPAVDRRAPSPA